MSRPGTAQTLSFRPEEPAIGRPGEPATGDARKHDRPWRSLVGEEIDIGRILRGLLAVAALLVLVHLPAAFDVRFADVGSVIPSIDTFDPARVPAALSAYLATLASGSLGVSSLNAEPVADVLRSRFALSFRILIWGVATAAVLTLPLGWAASRFGGRRPAAVAFNLLGTALPNYLFVWLIQAGILMAASFGLRGLNLIYPAAREPLLWDIVLPGVAVGLPAAVAAASILTASLDRVHDRDFIRTAYAKGLSRRQVLRRHVWRHAAADLLDAAPALTVLLFSDLIIVERLFFVPGAGSYLVSITRHDLDQPVIAGIVVTFGAIYLAVETISAVLLHYVDPRLREAGEA